MQHIELHKQGGLAEVVLNRPKVNAMNSDLLAEMQQLFEELAEDEQVRGVLLRGEGKCLSAGLDLKQVATLDDAQLERFLDGFDAAFSAVFRYPRPLAVAVTGHAIAGGLVLAMCADYIAFGQGPHQHGLTELVVGVPFPRVAIEIVKHAAQGRAFRTLVYGAGTHTPEQLYQWGVGDSLVDEPVEDARRWLQQVIGRPLDTFEFVKATDRQDAQGRIDTQSLGERQLLVKTMMAARKAMMG